MHPNEIYQRLNEIPRWKENILMAEFAVFLHNLGKCHEFFVQKQSTGYRVTNQYFYDMISGSMRKWADQNIHGQFPNDIEFNDAYNESDTVDTKLALDSDFRNFLWENTLSFPEPIHDLISRSNESHGYPFGFFIDFQRVKRWFNNQRPFVIEKLFAPWKNTKKAADIDRILRLAQISHAICSEYEGSSAGVQKQEYEKTFQATAFGYEINKRIEVEKNPLQNYLSQTENKILKPDLKTRLLSKQPGFYEELAKIFQNVISETARPRNDCTLWDFSHTAGSFFKAFIAWSILEPENELWQKLGTEEDRKKLPLNLQYLTISWDYFQFVQSSTKIIDLLSRKAYLDEAISRLRKYLELEMPLANQIFEDENGLVFLAPGCFDKLLKQGDGETTFRKTLEGFFLAPRETPWVERYAELIPDVTTITIEYPPKKKKDDKPINNDLDFGKMIGERKKSIHHTSDAKGFQKLWQNISFDVCPVCGLRPIGYDDSGNPPEKKKEKAKQRKVCLVCEEHRIERSDDWVKNHLDRTIWIEELCDENDRVALITGRFGLDDWFDPELNLGSSISKIISFARARRIWETTAIFWKELFEEELVKNSILEKHFRLKLKPLNRVNLAPGHAFEADQNQKNYQRFQIYWDGEFIHFISPNWKDFSYDKALRVYPEEIDGKPVRKLEQSVEVLLTHTEEPVEYTPFIELLREPALAMALVPAKNAIACITKIKEKYDKEMGKVKDRLPLNLGVIFFPKNTPIAPVIDAGRRMSHYSFGPEKWEVLQVERTEFHPETRNPVKWQILAKEPLRSDELKLKFDTALGNGKHDEFHCKLLKVVDAQKEGDVFTATPIADIQKGDFIRVSVSHFDFIFLDQAGKRFELSLNDGQIHRFNETLDKSPGTRPYLLEDFSRLEKIWEIVQKTNLGKSNSALHGFRDLLLQKYRAWKIGSPQVSKTQKRAFKALTNDVIKKELTEDLTAEELQILDVAINEGIFFDCLELHLHILKEKQNEK